MTDVPVRRERTRLVDVAEQAGVSKSTASRILNDSPGVSFTPGTRERVIEVARMLNYHPHAAARRLKRAQPGALSLVVPSLTNPIFALISRGCVQRALEQDIAVLITEDLVARETDATVGRLLRSGRIDGVIVASGVPDHPLLESLAALQIPYVFALRSMPGTSRNVILKDEAASALAVDHLCDLGHIMVGHIAGPLTFSSARRLERGFRVRAAARGVREAVVEEEEFTEEGGARAANRLLARPVRPTGITAASPSQAIGALHAALRFGLSVPDDLSIVACGDASILEFLYPPLTAVHLAYPDLGSAAVDALIEQLNGGEPHDITVETDPVTILRGSSASPSRHPGL